MFLCPRQTGSIPASNTWPSARWVSETSQDGVLTNIMDELLDLGLHAPVAELNLAQLVGAHEGPGLSCCARPVISQRSSACLGRAVQPGVLFCFVLAWGHGIPHDVDGIWGVPAALSNTSPLQPVLLLPHLGTGRAAFQEQKA